MASNLEQHGSGEKPVEPKFDAGKRIHHDESFVIDLAGRHTNTTTYLEGICKPWDKGAVTEKPTMASNLAQHGVGVKPSEPKYDASKRIHHDESFGVDLAGQHTDGDVEGFYRLIMFLLAGIITFLSGL